jgi:hypothetical protein
VPGDSASPRPLPRVPSDAAPASPLIQPAGWHHGAQVSRLPRTKVEKALVGPAGEHYVLYQLYRHGMLASLAPPGTPTVDVLVLATDQSVVATVQVKTRTYGADGGWHMSEKHEHIVEPRCFYAFVDLEPDSPATFVVPSTVVAEVLAIAHRAWLATPGRGGRPHRDHTMRRILPSYSFEVDGYPPGWLDRYRDRWDLLGRAIDAADA